MKLLRTIFGIFSLLKFNAAIAQKVTIEVLQQGTSYEDSSYYDIMPVGDKFWIGGKYGTFKTIDADGNLANISYPNQGVDIYKLDHFDQNNIIASADKGVVYKHNLLKNSWEVIKVNGYEKSCFYNLAVENDSTAYICGGNTAIAHSNKTIPKGFILKTTDRGLTWKRVYNNLFKMVWCVKVNPFNHKIYALMYTPNKTQLYRLEGEDWKKECKIGNSIFHEIQFENEHNFIATGGWIGKKGRIYRNNQQTVIPNSGLIWGRVTSEKYDLYGACDGKIVLDDKTKPAGNYHVFGTKLNKAFSIYEIVFTSPNTAFGIGSARTLLKIKIDEEKQVANSTLK